MLGRLCFYKIYHGLEKNSYPLYTKHPILGHSLSYKLFMATYNLLPFVAHLPYPKQTSKEISRTEHVSLSFPVIWLFNQSNTSYDF